MELYMMGPGKQQLVKDTAPPPPRSYKCAAVTLAVLWILSVVIGLGVIFHRSLFANNSELENRLKDMENNYSALQKNQKNTTESWIAVQRSLLANNSALQIQLKDTEKNYSDLQKNHKRVTESCNNGKYSN
ncbi:hypothetical protein EOD39_19356 [Acipenser ruthenus]|uniref:Uncharacterized protein n=1 Tax=Acipenser ruthenus TaxID=7906 RepID=A0A444UYB3_ACIRT|nr:hypothetical protein EOD39_19356 [Acipenser ruthenus]